MENVAVQAPGKNSAAAFDVTPEVACLQDKIVNLYFVGAVGAQWALVDAGLYGSAKRIKSAAEERYGANAKPQCIVVTHGHFDHRGALKELAEEWDVSVYAHELELPYLTGRSSYPPPDPTVGGGAMARLSFLYPKKPIDIGGRVRALPADGSVPGVPGWRWIHTPGHTPGHVSLFRDSDRTLIAGDAFVTTKQESALAALTQQPPHVRRPPAYFTPDWVSARASVELLAALKPEVAATGHGLPMRGAEMRRQLDELARDFDELAVPEHGRYVPEPAVADERGVVRVPPPVADPVSKAIIGLSVAALAGAVLFARSRGRR